MALIVGIGIITMCLGFVVWRRINVGAACVLVGIVIVGYSGSSEIYPRAIVFGLLTAGIGFVFCGGDPGFLEVTASDWLPGEGRWDCEKSPPRPCVLRPIGPGACPPAKTTGGCDPRPSAASA